MHFRIFPLDNGDWEVRGVNTGHIGAYSTKKKAQEVADELNSEAEIELNADMLDH